MLVVENSRMLLLEDSVDQERRNCMMAQVPGNV